MERAVLRNCRSYRPWVLPLPTQAGRRLAREVISGRTSSAARRRHQRTHYRRIEVLARFPKAHVSFAGTGHADVCLYLKVSPVLQIRTCRTCVHSRNPFQYTHPIVGVPFLCEIVHYMAHFSAGIDP